MTLPSPLSRLPVSVAVRRCGAGLLGLLMLATAPAAACPPDVRPAPPLVLGQAAKIRADGRPLRILAIGSSTTAGAGASSVATNYPSQLALRLEAALGEGSVEITNAGVNGESAPATLRRLELFLKTAPVPDLVLWQVGTNDVIFGGDPVRLKQLVGAGLDAIAAAGAAALVIDQQYYPAILDLNRYENFVAAVGEAASEHGAPLLPRYQMMKQWAAQDPAGLRATLAWDRFHSNDKGYACLADLLAPAIVTAVAVPAAARHDAQAKTSSASTSSASTSSAKTSSAKTSSVKEAPTPPQAMR